MNKLLNTKLLVAILLGFCLFFVVVSNVAYAGKYEESIPPFEKRLQSSPNNLIIRIFLTASYSFLGREKETREAAKEILRIDPKFSIEKYAKSLRVKDKETLNSIVDALRKAGLE